MKITGLKITVLHNSLMKWDGCFRPFDDSFLQRALHSVDGRIPILRVNNKLSNERIVVWGNLITGINMSVHSNTVPAGCIKLFNFRWGRDEVI